jgi:DNA-binding transcriptional ArsR family regulator
MYAEPGPPDVFKALGDPVRWSIVQQMARQDELACSVLEETLPVTKPTISYHVKILAQAGVISVRKRGRNYFYALRHELLREVIAELGSMAPGAGGPGGTNGSGSVAGDESASAAPTLLTW